MSSSRRGRRQQTVASRQAAGALRAAPAAAVSARRAQPRSPAAERDRRSSSRLTRPRTGRAGTAPADPGASQRAAKPSRRRTVGEQQSVRAPAQQLRVLLVGDDRLDEAAEPVVCQLAAASVAARLLVGQVCQHQTQPPPGVAIGRVALDPLAQFVGLVFQRPAASATRSRRSRRERSARGLRRPSGRPCACGRGYRTAPPWDPPNTGHGSACR